MVTILALFIAAYLLALTLEGLQWANAWAMSLAPVFLACLLAAGVMSVAIWVVRARASTARSGIRALDIRPKSPDRRESMEPRTFLGFTGIEWAILAVILLAVARFYWARELRAVEDAVFAWLGLDPPLQLIIIVPIAIYLAWRFFNRERIKASSAGRPVVRKSVLALCAGLLAIAAALLIIH